MPNPAEASPRSQKPGYHYSREAATMGVFRLDQPPTPEDAEAALQVLGAYSFPWEWTVARNVRETRQALIPVGFNDRSGSAGFYDPRLNRIDVDPVAVLGSRFGRTLAHEAGHLIDDTVLFNDTRRAIHALMHDGSPVPLADCPSEGFWRKGDRHQDIPSEAFANLAPHIWCPAHAKPIDRYGPHLFHRAADIEELVMADAEKNPPFDDIAGTVFEDDILWAARHGIAFGRDGSFLPNQPVTRGQLMAFLRRAIDKEQP